MSRYVDAPVEVEKMLEEVRNEYFPELMNCHVKVLMDSKKKMHCGRIVVACIKKTSNVEKYLTADNVLSDGFDFIMFIDSNIFFNLSEEDKVRIIRHELRHIFYDSEATVPYKTIDHDVTDFMVEIELNHDDLKWNQRVSEIAQSVYSKE